MLFYNLLAGFSSAEIQLLWKELTNGITEDKTTTKSDIDPSANNIKPSKLTRRQTGDRQAAPPRRAEW